MKTKAYHFTGWIVHAGGRKYTDGIRNPKRKVLIEKKLVDYTSSRFFKVLEAGKLQPPRAGVRCAAHEIELLAGDDKIVWLTVDPTFGFANSKEAWSFGFVYDPEILIIKYDGCVRENDFINDYAEILRNVIKKYKCSKGVLPNKPDRVCATFKSLPNDVRKSCLSVFKKEAKKFRAENELQGVNAIERLKAKRPPPYEIVVRKPVPLNEAESFIVAGSVVGAKELVPYLMELLDKQNTGTAN